jgi:toxin-antitoxin system PIN domain toxin
VLLGFLRITTNPRVFPAPLEPRMAMEVIDGWLEQPGVRVLVADRDHWRILRRLVDECGTAGNLTTDAHLAALAIRNGAELQSTDADFGRFRRLDWVNPLRRAGAG